MFKRFQVINLFERDKDLTVSEWVDVKKEIPNLTASIFMVKLKDGKEIKAIFCLDKCTPLGAVDSSHWWYSDTGLPIEDVTHWGR